MREGTDTDAAQLPHTRDYEPTGNQELMVLHYQQKLLHPGSIYRVFISHELQFGQLIDLLPARHCSQHVSPCPQTSTAASNKGEKKEDQATDVAHAHNQHNPPPLKFNKDC